MPAAQTQTSSTLNGAANPKLAAARAEAAAIKAKRNQVAETANPTESSKTENTDLFGEMHKRYQEAQDALLASMGTVPWKRALAALVSAVFIGLGVGFIAGNLLNWIVAGALLYAAPLFLVVVVYAIGVALSLYYGTKLVARVAGAVLTGEADQRAVAAYDATKAFLVRFNPFAKMVRVDEAKASA